MQNIVKSWLGSFSSKSVKADKEVPSVVPVSQKQASIEPDNRSVIDATITKLASDRNELDRIDRYRQFREMAEGFPLTAKCFDFYVSELLPDQEPFLVDANSEAQGKAITNLFNRIKLDRMLSELIRQTIVYGDCFVELLIDPQNRELGVQGLRILNPSHVSRLDDANGLLRGYLVTVPTENQTSWTSDQNGSNTFVLLDKSQVVHFRLYSGEASIAPYGRSIAHPARKLFKQLQLMMDAQLIYRISRAPSRFAFYIETGSLPASKAEIFLEKQRQKIQKTKTVQNGNIDSINDLLSITEDFFIASNGKNNGSRVERFPSDPNTSDIVDIITSMEMLLAGFNLDIALVLGKEEGRGANQSKNVNFARLVSCIRLDIEDGLTQLANVHLALTNQGGEVTVKLSESNELLKRRKLDAREQEVRLAQAELGLGIVPIEEVWKTLGYGPEEVATLKAQLAEQAKDPILSPHVRQNGQPSSNPDPAKLNADSGDSSNGLDISTRNNRRGESKQVPQD